MLRVAYVTKLQMEGFQAEEASNGEQALAKVKTFEPDLIMLDILMPKVSGLDFMRAYPKSKHPKVKIIVFSNSTSPETVKEAMKLGADKYLTKADFTPNQMIEAAKEVLAS